MADIYYMNDGRHMKKKVSDWNLELQGGFLMSIFLGIIAVDIN